MADVSWPGGVSDVRGRLGLVAFTAPTVVERLLTADVAGEIARTFGISSFTRSPSAWATRWSPRVPGPSLPRERGSRDYPGIVENPGFNAETWRFVQ
jgi:hypothetical protein